MSAMSRRGLMRSMGGAALALPFLSAMRTGAQGMVAPKRFLVMFTPNGVFKPNWFPTGTEHDWEISPCLAPLARHKDRLLVLGGQGWDPDYDATHNARDHIGVSIKCLPSLPSQGHELQSMLTGLPGAEFDGQTWANGPSIDQIIATGPQVMRIRYQEDGNGNRTQPLTGWIRETPAAPVFETSLDIYLSAPYLAPSAIGLTLPHDRP